MIDPTGSDVCQRVVQTAHWIRLYIQIICRCRLHKCLLSVCVLLLTLQKYYFFGTYANKSAKIFQFSLISISTQYFKGRFFWSSGYSITDYHYIVFALRFLRLLRHFRLIPSIYRPSNCLNYLNCLMQFFALHYLHYLHFDVRKCRKCRKCNAFFSSFFRSF